MFPKMNGTDWFDLVEVPNNSATPSQTKLPIPDQAQLRSDEKNGDICVQAIETYNVFDIAVSPANNPVATPAMLLNTYVTLYMGSDLRLQTIPMNNIHRVEAFDATPTLIPFQRELFKTNNTQVIWDKSFFTNPSGFGGTTFSFLLGVHYTKIPYGAYENIEKLIFNNYVNVQV